MNDDIQPARPGDDTSEPYGSETVEYEKRVAPRGVVGEQPRRNRGYWADPADDDAAVAGEPLRGGARTEATGTTVAKSGPSNGPDRKTRIRRLLRLAVLLVVLAGLAIGTTLILTGRAVMPFLSERIFPIRYQEDIARVADKYGQDPYLIAAVVKAESGYDPGVTSPAGAVGLMQVMPDTAAWVVAELSSWQGDEDPDLTDPIDNLELGACYLAYLGETFGDGTQLALAAYNAGPGTVAGWVESAGGRGDFDLSDIQFPETRHYVERVEHYRLLYMRIHPGVFGTARPEEIAAAAGTIRIPKDVPTLPGLGGTW
jgi:soluble lytic murein transglycosylase